MANDLIFDAHMHVDDVPALGWRMTGRQCIEAMDRAGIQKAVVMTILDLPALNPNALDQIADTCAEFPGRLYAFARIHPFYGAEAVAILEKAFARYSCFKGLKLHPVSTLSHPGSKETVQLIRKAAEHNAPTLFHCGDEPLTTPLQIALAADACPDATIILGHMGGYYHVDEAIRVAERYPNVVLETSAMPYPAKIRAAVERIGADRVIYGSDGPVASPIIEVEKVRLAQLDSHSERKVFGLNIQRIIDAVA
jgi:predicted TIM-barrel fold metal-dependent hydrolase